MGRKPEKWGPRQLIDHTRLNEMIDGPVYDIVVGPGLRKETAGNTVAITLDYTPPSPGFWARLTDYGTVGGVPLYSWEEASWSESGGWVQATGGLTGTLNAYEVNDTRGIPNYTDQGVYTIVWMRPRYYDSAEAKWFYMFDLGFIKGNAAASPTTERTQATPTSVGQETADSGAWLRSLQATGRVGLWMMMQTRTVYDDAGDQTLYGFYRHIEFDGNGKLVQATAETRYVIATPGGCE